MASEWVTGWLTASIWVVGYLLWLFSHISGFVWYFTKKNSGLDMVYVFEQESLANAKVSVWQQWVYEGP